MGRQHPVMPYQPRLVEAAERSSALSAQNKEPRYSLHPLRPHDLHHLPRSNLVEARARVAVADVRLNIEGLRGHAGLDLVVERRQGRVRVRAREYRQRAHALWHEGREA